MTDRALILNAGSSSLKFQVYARPDEEWTVEVSGQIEGIGSAPKLKVRDDSSAVINDTTLPPSVRDGRLAFDVLAGWLHDHFGDATLSAVGHRVVHGGTKYDKACVVTPEVIKDLRALVPLAPLHQPHNVSAIETVAERLPKVPQVACFDTAFHRTMSPVAQLGPLTEGIRESGVQRYGFHGLSYEYIAAILPSVAPKIAGGRVIVAHLGSGASVCAMKARQSVDCTFGFTPLDGLCMGTRPGSTDPGVILHLFQTLKLSAADVEKILYKKSGLLGISGISNDMRDLEENTDPRAKLAVAYFVYEAVKHIGALTAILGGVDAIVFTAGIGEHSSIIRRRICESLSWLGIELDEASNDRHASQITKPNSRVSVWIIPTNEELMIARHTGDLLGLRQHATSGTERRSK